MADQQYVQVGRLALRVEGDYWNAYYAPHDTGMQDAMLLCSMRLSLAYEDERMKDAFKAFARTVLAKACRDALGHEPTWHGERKAPEDERGGSA